MIPGNIDLTENLDFRKVIKKEIPKLPVQWDEKNHLNSYDGTISITSNYNSNYSTSSVNYVTNVTWYDMTTIVNNELLPSDTTIGWTTYTNNITTTTINTSLSYIDDICTCWNVIDNNCIITPKKEYDVFGNLKQNTVEVIPKIPWDWDTKPCKYPIKDICWRSHYGRISENDYEPDIPWDYYIRPLKPINMDDIIDRAKNLICWLHDKSSSFILRYMESEDENVDLSYLTNMSWIRIHDAVIDSI